MKVLAVLALLAAAVLLVLGYVNGQPGLVWVALGLSGLAMVFVLAPALLSGRRTPLAEAETGADEDGEASAPVRDDPSVVEERESVVFQPGKLTFHVAGCPELGAVPTSIAARAQLEAGGMKPCPHCLTAAG